MESPGRGDGTESDFVTACVRSAFGDSDDSRALISSLPRVHGDSVTRESSEERFLVIMDEYQEQPHLLDPHLDWMMNMLLDFVKTEESPPSLIHLSFRFLYIISKVRGYKTFMQLLPHEVADLQPVLDLLSKQDPSDSETWETRYVLLLWLSTTCLIPFDLARLDGHMETDDGSVKETTMERILNIAKSYLVVRDSPRNAASVLVSKFMTRPDVKKKNCLQEFINWSLETIQETDDQLLKDVMVLDGVLQSLAKIFKHAKREDLPHYAPLVLKSLEQKQLLQSSQAMLRKLSVKLIQRIGLTFLKPRLASWRYQRGSRSLAANLSMSQSGGAADPVSAAVVEEDDEDDYEIAEEVESVVEYLLVGLKDRETIVRWSAAKGMGRVTGRLPKDLADEVVGSLLDCFSFQETDNAWHGGCLALAELGRRGLLLPSRLTDVVPLIVKALTYEEKRGACSVGSNVRDAACYVCWSFARAYEPKELQPFVNQIASALLITAVFDRNVNCRRAASAAFQENVGRQVCDSTGDFAESEEAAGTFPHGIDMVTEADYYAVGNLNNCFLTISVNIAAYPEYTRAMIHHLITMKINHWDTSIRELASKALHNLTPQAPDHMATTVLPQLLTRAVGLDLHYRHGAILSCAEVTHALHKLGLQTNRTVVDMISPECVDALREIHQTLLSRKQYRGFGGELMRPAVCCLIEKLSLSKMPFRSDAVIGEWQNFLDDTIQTLHLFSRGVKDTIMAAVISALSALCEEYYQTESGEAEAQIQDSLLRHYLDGLKSPQMLTRCGCALALGSLPKFIIHGKLQQVLEGLHQTCAQKESGFTEARRDAVTAISQVCVTAGVRADGSSDSVVCRENVAMVYDMILENLKDYTIDSRGDVGAWVREATMTSLMEVTMLVSAAAPEILSAEQISCMMCSLAQQAAEKIDRYRAHAGQTFLQLLHSTDPAVPHIPHREELLDIFPLETQNSLNWNAPSQSFQYISRLLVLPRYLYHTLLGLTVSVGGITESLVHFSSQSLFGYMKKIQENDVALTQFGNVLLSILRDHLYNDRVNVPFLQMLSLMLTNSCFEIFTKQDDHPFCVSILDLCKNLRKSKEVFKLRALISVYCGLIQFQGEVRKSVLSQLLVLLCHSFPVIRKTTASQMYEMLLTYDDVIDPEVMDDVVTLLSDTNWESDMATVRLHRNQLCDWMGVARPQLVSKKPVLTS